MFVNTRVSIHNLTSEKLCTCTCINQCGLTHYKALYTLICSFFIVTFNGICTQTSYSKIKMGMVNYLFGKFGNCSTAEAYTVLILQTYQREPLDSLMSKVKKSEHCHNFA